MSFSRYDIPTPVIKLIETLHAKNFEGWLVGGAIRTLLLGKTPKDWDVTTSATPAQVQKIFSQTIETGIKYGTVTVMIDAIPIQVTTFRKEGAYENHRQPEDVSFCLSLEEDLSRRDFTMNAIAFNPVTDELRDPFDGQKDIEHQWIKTVGEPTLRFNEDALRILRAIRFQSQLGFFIEDPTLTAMAETSHLLASLSRERIQEEFSKWLQGEFFSMTRPTARQINLVQIFDIKPHPDFEGQWDRIGVIGQNLLFRLYAFFDLFTGPDSTSIKTDNCLKLLKSLKYSQHTISKVIQFIEFLIAPLDVEVREERLVFLKKALEIGFEDAILILDWKLQHSQHKILFLKAKDQLIRLQNSGYEKRVFPLAIDGNAVMKILNIQPGPQVRESLNSLQNLVLENPDLNSQAQLETLLHKK